MPAVHRSRTSTNGLKQYLKAAATLTWRRSIVQTTRTM